MLRTAEPKDETPGGVPFIIGESHDIENDCILSPPFFIGIHPITVSSITKFGRFCGAIHSVDWACISVLSQVIHSVNERKTVQTNMISFVSHGAGLLSKNFVKLCFTKFLLRSPAECPANRNIIFRLYRFSDKSVSMSSSF